MTFNSLPKIKYNLLVDKYCNSIIYYDDNERDAAFNKLNKLTSLTNYNQNLKILCCLDNHIYENNDGINMIIK
jgi:hypothetical protein